VGKKAGISLATADLHRAQGIVTRRAGIVRNLVGISLAAAEGHRAFAPVVYRVSRTARIVRKIVGISRKD